MAINVHEKPSQGPGFPGKQIETAVIWVDSVGVNYEKYRLWVGFYDARGPGKRNYHLHIEPASFRELAEAMIRTDRQEAIKAFGTALQMDVPEPMPNGKRWSPEKMESKAAA